MALENEKETGPLGLSSLVDMFASLCVDSKSTFVMLDALDECSVEQLQGILHVIERIGSLPALKIFCTSRPHVVECRKFFEGSPTIEISAEKSDLENYLAKRLLSEWKLSESMKCRIMRQLPPAAEGMYVLLLNQPLTK
jgi:hypothetical protein